MKTLVNGLPADVFTTRELKEMQKEIARVLKEREKEREKLMRQYQEKLDDLLDTIKGDDFNIEWDDYSNPVIVYEDED